MALVKYRPLAQAVLFYNEYLEMYSAVLPSVHQLVWLEHSHRVCELQWPLVVTIFNMGVSTCAWFWHSGMRPLGQQVGFSDPPANVEAESYIKQGWLILNLMEWESPSFVWCILCFSKVFMFYYKYIFILLMFFEVTLFHFGYALGSWKHMLKMDSDICDDFVSPT
jgi:hypothetical protein